MMAKRASRKGLGFEIRTFRGSKRIYIVFRYEDGSYHVFGKTEAKAAAKDCGANLKGDQHTKEYWNSLWDHP
jgi:hypothetical protein